MSIDTNEKPSLLRRLLGTGKKFPPTVPDSQSIQKDKELKKAQSTADNQAFYNAVSENNLPKVRRLLQEKHIDINYVDPTSGRTALDLAVDSNAALVDIALLLSTKGIEVKNHKNNAFLLFWGFAMSFKDPNADSAVSNALKYLKTSTILSGDKSEYVRVLHLTIENDQSALKAMLDAGISPFEKYRGQNLFDVVNKKHKQWLVKYVFDNKLLGENTLEALTILEKWAKKWQSPELQAIESYRCSIIEKHEPGKTATKPSITPAETKTKAPESVHSHPLSTSLLHQTTKIDSASKPSSSTFSWLHQAVNNELRAKPNYKERFKSIEEFLTTNPGSVNSFIKDKPLLFRAIRRLNKTQHKTEKYQNELKILTLLLKHNANPYIKQSSEKQNVFEMIARYNTQCKTDFINALVSAKPINENFDQQQLEILSRWAKDWGCEKIHKETELQLKQIKHTDLSEDAKNMPTSQSKDAFFRSNSLNLRKFRRPPARLGLPTIPEETEEELEEELEELTDKKNTKLNLTSTP